MVSTVADYHTMLAIIQQGMGLWFGRGPKNNLGRAEAVAKDEELDETVKSVRRLMSMLSAVAHGQSLMSFVSTSLCYAHAKSLQPARVNCMPWSNRSQCECRIRITCPQAQLEFAKLRTEIGSWKAEAESIKARLQPPDICHAS